jgi:hypothetical protein
MTAHQPRPGSVSGNVRETKDGPPIAGARIHLTPATRRPPSTEPPPQPRTLTADERGNFAADDLEPWGWLIEITALGYIPSSSHTFLISSGQTEEFNVQLWRKPPPIPIFSEFAKVLITLNAGALVLIATFVTQAQLTTPQSQLAQLALVFFMNGLVTSLAAFAVALTREHDRRLRDSTPARYTAFTFMGNRLAPLRSRRPAPLPTRHVNTQTPNRHPAPQPLVSNPGRPATFLNLPACHLRTNALRAWTRSLPVR